MADQTYPVLWEDPRYGRPATGRLEFSGDHAMLSGLADGEARVVEFEAAEVAAVELVSRRERRLRGRPTVMVTLHDRGRVLIAEAMGIGISLEIATQLSAWV